MLFLLSFFRVGLWVLCPFFKGFIGISERGEKIIPLFLKKCLTKWMKGAILTKLRRARVGPSEGEVSEDIEN